MKRLSLLLPVLVLMLAVFGAFEMKSTNAVVATQVWFDETPGNPLTQCLSADIDLEPCQQSGGSDCRKDVTIGASTYPNRVLHKDNSCNNAYKRNP